MIEYLMTPITCPRIVLLSATLIMFGFGQIFGERRR